MHRSLRYHGPFELSLACDNPECKPLGRDQVRIEVMAVTICATDVNILRGLYPAKPSVTLGHEAAGRVITCGPEVTDLALGEMVVIDPTPYCDTCATCRRGLRNHCERKDGTEAGVSCDGAFASSFVTSAKMVRRLPPDFPVVAACMTEPCACVLNAVRQLKLNPAMEVAVVGGGPIGVLFTHALALAGVSGVLVDSAPARLELARKLLPPRWTTCGSFADALDSFSSRREFHVVVDACGAANTEMVLGLSRGGQLLLAGLKSSSLTFDPMMVTDRSLSLIGSIDSNGTFDQALQLVTSGRIPAREMVTRQFPLSNYREAFLAVGLDLDRREFVPGPPEMKVALLPQE